MAKIITTYGHTQVDTAVKKFGTGSILFDNGGDDYIDTPNTSDFNFHSQDITIDFWIRWVGGNHLCGLCDDTGLGWRLRRSDVNYLLSFPLRWYPLGSGGVNKTGTIQLTDDGLFHHIAFVVYGSVATLYRDGAVDVSYDFSGNTLDNNVGKLTLGRSGEWTDTVWLNGWIDEFRFSNTARWTADFSGSLPSAAYTYDANTMLLIHGDGTDGSTKFYDGNPPIEKLSSERARIKKVYAANFSDKSRIKNAISNIGSMKATIVGRGVKGRVKKTVNNYS